MGMFEKPLFCLPQRVSKVDGLVSFRYGEANRSGDNCHGKGSFLLTVLKRGQPCYTGPHREAMDLVRRQE